MFEIGSVVGGGSGALDALTADIDALLAADPRDNSLVDTVGDIAVLHAQMNRLQAVMLKTVAVVDADAGHHLAGYATTGAMLTDGLRLNAGQGQAMVHHARSLKHRFPATFDALAAGDISLDHARAIRRAEKKLPSARLGEAEQLLLDVARVANPAAVRAAVDRLIELVDPQDHDRDVQEEYAHRNLSLSKTLDGWWALDAHLPPEVGLRLNAALEQFAAPADQTDTRTAVQRNADAIGQIADAALDGTTAGISAVTIVADAEKMDGVGAAWGHDGLPVGLSGFSLAVCQAELTLVVADKHDRMTIRWSPLAVGMVRRFATQAQRAALSVRDRGCVHRGCTRPPQWCNAHHVIDWRDGGPTDLSNLVFLCAYHHRMVHLGRAEIVEDPAHPGFRIAIPTRRHTTTAA